MSKFYTIIATDETWFPVGNATLCIITEEEYEKLESGLLEPKDLAPVCELLLREVTP